MISRLEHNKTKLILGVGFGSVVVLMVATTLIALQQFQALSDGLNEVVQVQNKKTALAHIMRDAVRQRATGLHNRMLSDDPFARDQEMTRTFSHAFSYIEAQKKLMSLPMSDAERRIHKKLYEDAGVSQPLYDEAADLLAGFASRDIIHHKLTEVQKVQNKVLDSLGELVALQEARISINRTHAETNLTDAIILITGLAFIAT